MCPVRPWWRALTAQRVESVPVDSIPVESAPVVSGAWRARVLLTGADLSDFIALRRVCGRTDSHVTQVGDGFYDGERQLLSHVEDGVRMLIEVGFATLGEPDPEDGRQLVTVRPDGRARYEELCERQGYPPYPDPRSTTEGWQF
jgi:hypothetical protein